MIGYWLVLAMVLCALVAVVAAYATETPEPEADLHPPPRRLPNPKHQVWLALGSSGTMERAHQDESPAAWVSLVSERLPPDAVGHDLSTPRATVAEVRRDQLPEGLDSAPDVAALWIGLDDLLGGTSIDAFEEDLLAVLARLSGAGCALVLATVPDITGQPELESIGFSPELLRLHVERWNASIMRLGSALGAVVIDDRVGPEDIAMHVQYLDDPEILLSARGHARLADLLAPPIRRALGEHR
ncbi:MAG: GDSL-type esterase/lipase family protein [Chloroflexota bacterium]|nr:GDSL-type esterase/lipase family protein [Chloroflexota bacterium]